MDKQLFIGPNKPDQSLFVPPIPKMSFFKPNGGLWSSSYDEKYGSEWVQFCLENLGSDNKFQSWLLKIRPNARVYEIDQYKDLEKLVLEYGKTLYENLEMKEIQSFNMTFDFQRLAKDYDAIHLTSKGQNLTRFSMPYTLYGWDCESTLWLNWVFDSVEDLSIKEYERQDI